MPALAVIVALGLAVWPNALRLSDWDLAVLPFALILLGAFLVAGVGPRPAGRRRLAGDPFSGLQFCRRPPLDPHLHCRPRLDAPGGGSVGRFQIKLKSQISNLKSQISNFQPPISNSQPPTLQPPISNLH